MTVSDLLEQPCNKSDNKFFVGLHGDKIYNSFVCGNILLALMKIQAYGSKALQ